MHRAGNRRAQGGRELVDALATPAAFGHAVGEIELLETHISWVILAGDYVYKIKKPVVFDFLDFRDLGRRRFFCEEEVRLNRFWAPDIYLDVVPVTSRDGQPVFGGDGEPLEFAVRMRRFDQDALLDRQLERGLLTGEDMRRLGEHVAGRHAAAEAIGAGECGRLLAATLQFMRDNFTALRDVMQPAEFDALYRWTEDEIARLDGTLRQRCTEGFFRECHGDLHLGNLVRLPRGIVAFDCIEFNADLRQIDVMCDVTFLLMDLVARRHHDLAAHFLNRYLECSGDYAGMQVFSLYFVYRSLVRAKVAAIRYRGKSDAAGRDAERAALAHYCGMASRQIARRVPMLVVTSGLSGTGKTWLTSRLYAALPAVRIRSDLERKRMFGLGETASSGSGVGQGIYSGAANAALYERMLEAARVVLAAGHNVILDAAFLQRDERAAAVAMAGRAGAVPLLLALSVPEAIARQRILERAARADDASEAGLAVFERQLATAERVTDDECARIVRVDASAESDAAALAADIRTMCRPES